MTFHDSNGATLSKSAFTALTTAVPNPEAQFKLTAPVYQRFTYYGEGKFETGNRLLFKAGDVVTQSQIDTLFTAATVTTVTPATGLAAGGTNVTIAGTNLGGVSAVSFGGNAATNVKVVDETKVTCTVPAHAAGAVPVVVTDDSGPVTKANGFTYT